MEATVSSKFSTLKVITSIVLVCSIAASFWWVSYEWAENLAPLPESKVIKPWMPGGHNAPILTDAARAGWKSSTPPIAVSSREVFSLLNTNSVILHYGLLPKFMKPDNILLTYYGRTIDGNLLMYDEMFDSANFVQGKNYEWRVGINREENTIVFFAKDNFNTDLLLSIIIAFASLILTALVGSIMWGWGTK